MIEVDPLDNPGILKVEILNPGSGKLDITLGISDERSDEIIKLVREYWLSSTDVTEVMVKISRRVYHPNELGYACIIIGDIHSQQSRIRGIMRKKDDTTSATSEDKPKAEEKKEEMF